MKIFVANLTLRFYEKDGWTEDKVRDYLINPKMQIDKRDMDFLGSKDIYYSCYENSGHKIFSKRLWDNEFDNPFKNDITWYIGDK